MGSVIAASSGRAIFPLKLSKTMKVRLRWPCLSVSFPNCHRYYVDTPVVVRSS
jgi:hypothetical protein